MRPFLKWVGGKGQLLEELVPHVPAVYGRYHEPFLGGGALFFRVRPRRARLADANSRLVRTWRAVRDDVDGVIERLSALPHDRGVFLELRQRAIDAAADVDLAAWFIYLNRTGFNGLYRVNRHNVFNVAFGDYRNPTICDQDLLRAVSAELADVELDVADFGSVLEVAEPGDFVYFDPPYVPLSSTATFTKYTEGGFGEADQRRLRDVARTLKDRGVQVLLSNSDTPLVAALYADFQGRTVQASRNVNCHAEGRGRVAERLLF